MPTFTFIEITSCPILVLSEEKATEIRFQKMEIRKIDVKKE